MESTATLLSKLNYYATSRELNFELEELPEAPTVLRGLISGPGVCLTVSEPEPRGDSLCKLGVWLSTRCSEVTYCMMSGNDDKTEKRSDIIHGIDEKIILVDNVCCAFYLNLIFIPAIESWSEDKGIGCQVIKLNDFACSAIHCDCSDWHFIELKVPKPAVNNLVVGISGDGRAAVFQHIETDGSLDINEPVMRLKTGSDLKAWLDDLIRQA